MKIYKDLNNNLFGYELDGSQDSYIAENLIQITDAEADAIRVSQTPEPVPVVPPTASELMAQLIAIQEQIKALA